MQDLIERVEKATGPNYALECDIAKVLEPDRKLVPRNYTDSLDAVVRLIEAELPGWTIAHIAQDDGKRWHAELREGFLTSYNRVALSGLYSSHGGRKPGSPNGALALLLAVLRAKLSIPVLPQ